MRTKHHFNYYIDGASASVAVICNWSNFRDGLDDTVNYFFRAGAAAYLTAASHAGKEVAQANSYYLPANETRQAKESLVVAEINV